MFQREGIMYTNTVQKVENKKRELQRTGPEIRTHVRILDNL